MVVRRSHIDGRHARQRAQDERSDDVDSGRVPAFEVGEARVLFRYLACDYVVTRASVFREAD